jgi:hypothetical protein
MPTMVPAGWDNYVLVDLATGLDGLTGEHAFDYGDDTASPGLLAPASVDRSP